MHKITQENDKFTVEVEMRGGRKPILVDAMMLSMIDRNSETEKALSDEEVLRRMKLCAYRADNSGLDDIEDMELIAHYGRVVDWLINLGNSQGPQPSLRPYTATPQPSPDSAEPKSNSA